MFQKNCVWARRREMTDVDVFIPLGVFYITSCKGIVPHCTDYIKNLLQEYKYCPYCGKEIELKGLT